MAKISIITPLILIIFGIFFLSTSFAQSAQECYTQNISEANGNPICCYEYAYSVNDENGITEFEGLIQTRTHFYGAGGKLDSIYNNSHDLILMATSISLVAIPVDSLNIFFKIMSLAKAPTTK